MLCTNFILGYGECYKIKTGQEELPMEISRLVNRIKDYAVTAENKWYEKLGEHYWCVKGAEEVFCWNGMWFILYPQAVCKTHAFFEHMMLHTFEPEMEKMGINEKHCYGMLD